MKLDSDYYNHKLQQLFNRNPKTDLTKFKALVKNYNDPQHNFKSIHVAGTNGKGSVSTKIAKALEKEGFKVGLFTSPHISDYRERMQINSTMISKEDLIRLLPEEEDLSFFETTTLIALRWFAEQKVDWAVIEVGLGGRLDATNVINSKVAIITSISLEHTEILGNTVEEITREKKGIIKPTSKVIIGPKVASFEGAEQITGRFENYELENRAIAERALSFLKVSSDSISYGVQQSAPCRFETLGDVLLDVAHNPDGFKELVKRLGTTKRHFIFAISQSKDILSSLSILNPYALSYTLTESPSKRTMGAEQLKKWVVESGYDQTKINVIPSPLEALQFLLKKREPILVTGTFFIMDPIRAALI